jgi:hypothetical protein
MSSVKSERRALRGFRDGEFWQKSSGEVCVQRTETYEETQKANKEAVTKKAAASLDHGRHFTKDSVRPTVRIQVQTDVPFDVAEACPPGW